MKANKKILILIGIPASGKTTWALDYVSKNEKWIRVSRDDFRYMLKNSGETEHKVEQMISTLVINTIEQSIKSGLNVIVDSTHCKVSHINVLIDKFKYYADIDYRVFDISLDKAIERDRNRDKKVGVDTIKRMYNNYKILIDSFDFQPLVKQNRIPILPEDSEKTSAVIFDIDGTIAIMKNRHPFDWNKVDRDDLNWIVSEQIDLQRSLGRKIILVSGRSEEARELTEGWLEHYGIKYDGLFMRKKDDYRKDTVIKREIYQNDIMDSYNIMCVYDDRLDVVKMWSDLGIFCFNVNQYLHDF